MINYNEDTEMFVEQFESLPNYEGSEAAKLNEF